MAIYEIVASILLVVAALLVLATTVAVWRAPDALTRVNLLGPTICIAIPLLLAAKLVVDFSTEGFAALSLIKALAACFGVWIIGAIGSYYMGRAIYGVTITDVKHALRTQQQD